MNQLTGLVKWVRKKQRKVGWSTVSYYEIVIKTENGWKTLTFEGESMAVMNKIQPESLMELSYLTDGNDKIIRLRSAHQLSGPEFTPLREFLSASSQVAPEPPPSLTPAIPSIPKLDRLLNQVTDPTAKGILARATQESNLYTYQAATQHHHAYEGGLIRHSIGVAEQAISIADSLDKKPLSFNLSASEQEAFGRPVGILQPGTPINRDLLIAGALLHDIGKLKEYSKTTSGFVHNPGEHLYHTTSGQSMIEGWAPNNPNLEILDKLSNIVASHHVQEIYRARDIRRTPEALIVSLADSYDTNFSKTAEYIHQEYLEKLENLAADTHIAPDLLAQRMDQAAVQYEQDKAKLVNQPGGDLETAESRARRLRRFKK